MVDACGAYLRERLQKALGKDELGNDAPVFWAQKDLKMCVSSLVGAAMLQNDTLTISGRKIQNLETGLDDTKIWQRDVEFLVELGDDDMSKLNAAFETFLASLDHGFTHAGHYIGIELKEPAEWIDKKDSIINAELAVELPITFSGGIYKPVRYAKIKDFTLETEDSNG